MILWPSAPKTGTLTLRRAAARGGPKKELPMAGERCKDNDDPCWVREDAYIVGKESEKVRENAFLVTKEADKVPENAVKVREDAWNVSRPWITTEMAA